MNALSDTVYLIRICLAAIEEASKGEAELETTCERLRQQLGLLIADLESKSVNQ